ncbi:probable leucine-rich repeat receptor-like protein kinase [Tanacetum coccineum]
MRFLGTHRSDLLILKRIKESIETRDIICHSATIYASALMHAGTTVDTFLRKNMVMFEDLKDLNEIKASLGWRVVYAWIRHDPYGDDDLPAYEVSAVSIVRPFPTAVTNLLDLARLCQQGYRNDCKCEQGCRNAEITGSEDYDQTEDYVEARDGV